MSRYLELQGKCALVMAGTRATAKSSLRRSKPQMWLFETSHALLLLRREKQRIALLLPELGRLFRFGLGDVARLN
jgi:hypothetical protein